MTTAVDPAAVTRRVVAGVDCSEVSGHVLHAATRLAEQLSATLEVLFGYEQPHPSWTWPLNIPPEELHQHMQGLLESTVASAFPPDAAPVATIRAVERDPASTLMQAAHGADLLVVGSHGNGTLTDLMLGSVALKCVMHASGPVYVVASQRRIDSVPAEPDTGPDRQSAGRIVVGVDRSPQSAQALHLAAAFAVATGTGIDAVTTWPPPIYIGTIGAPCPQPTWSPHDTVLAELEEFVQQTFGAARPADLRLIAEEGYPEHRLPERARHAALLVLGNRGRGGFRSLVMGSVASRCVHRAACPVLVAHGAAPEPHDTAADPAADTAADTTRDTAVDTAAARDKVGAGT